MESATCWRIDQVGWRPGYEVQPGGLEADRRAQQLAGVRVLRVPEDVTHVALLDDAAGIHDRHPVARLGDDPEVVSDQQQRRVEVLRMSLRIWMICASTKTSNAVVGSSATTNAGRSTKASAIINRCRIPPENSCG